MFVRNEMVDKLDRIKGNKKTLHLFIGRPKSTTDQGKIRFRLNFHKS